MMIMMMMTRIRRMEVARQSNRSNVALALQL